MKANVSVIICAFNEERFIANAVESYLKQNAKPHEIIVVDDGSTDNTPFILSKLSALHPEIKVITNDANIGKVKSHNRAYRYSTGDFIAISGGDDIASADRLEVQIQILLDFNCDVVYNNMYLFNSVDDLNCVNDLSVLYPEFTH